MSEKILVIDDDSRFLRMVAQVLNHKNYQVITANSGHDGLRMLFEERPDLVILDVVMPKMNGWQTCSRIHDISDIPIIMLTGKRVDEEDIVIGLEHGADDYLVKTLGNKELVARVRAVLRRAELPPSSRAKEGISYDDGYLSVNTSQRRVQKNGQQIKLTPREFRLFSLLLKNASQILSHQQLLEKVWGWEYSNDVDYVRIYISHLRQKIEPVPSKPQYILTEPGVGYYFHPATESPGK